jgi:hypothetical protein
MSDKASAGEGQSNPAPEYLPLPTLPDSVAYDLTIAVTEARVQLYEELNAVWARSFPLDLKLRPGGRLLIRVEPGVFFGPLVTYAVRYYEAYARALLELKPRFSDYESWMNHALKSHVSDQLAPYRPEGKNRQLSEWQLHMGTTWRLFNHPQKADLFAEAKKLVDAVEDSMEPDWDPFTGALHTALSRRTFPLLLEGLKFLRNTPEIGVPAFPALSSEAFERIECSLKDARSHSLGDPTHANEAMEHYLDSIAWEYVSTLRSKDFEALVDKISERARTEFAGDAVVAEDRKLYWIREAKDRAANGIIGNDIPIRSSSQQIQPLDALKEQFRAMPGSKGDLHVIFIDGGRFKILSDHSDSTVDALERQKFEQLARQAMVALGFKFTDASRAIFYWLELLKQHSPHFKGWKIRHLCFASADFCAELETRALEAKSSENTDPGDLPSKEPKKAIRNDKGVQFPKRASWLSGHLRERAWNKHDLFRQGGPEHKTTQKILDGLAVREDVLEKVAGALSKKVGTVNLLDIPLD